MEIVRHKLNTAFAWHQGEGPYTTIPETQARAYRELGGFVYEDAFSHEEIAAVRKTGVQIGLVVGGGVILWMRRSSDRSEEVAA